MKGKIEYFTQLRQGFDNNRLKTKGRLTILSKLRLLE